MSSKTAVCLWPRPIPKEGFGAILAVAFLAVGSMTASPIRISTGRAIRPTAPFCAAALWPSRAASRV